MIVHFCAVLLKPFIVIFSLVIFVLTQGGTCRRGRWRCVNYFRHDHTQTWSIVLRYRAYMLLNRGRVPIVMFCQFVTTLGT